MKEILIVGSGFAGMSASLALADSGIKVNLIDSKPSMGGYFPLLDNQFPTNSCGVCFLSPKPPAYCPFIECSGRSNINFIPSSSVVEIDGEQGNFKVKLKIKSNPVDSQLCIDCGKCEEVCPVTVDNEFGEGVEKRKAVYKFYPKAVKKSYFLDTVNCTKCNKCVEICPVNAINLSPNSDKELLLDVSDIIFTPGFEAVKGGIKEEFGFGYNKNVLSSVQYERLISPSGPTSGVPIKLSDSTSPKSVAFLQCVGSRDIRKSGNPYCSSICCMFALKQAIFTKKQLPDCEVVFFYMDIRAFGKGYEEYYNKAKDEYGIKFIRCHLSTLKEHGQDKNIRVTYYKNGELKERDFDIAVLSLGFFQNSETRKLIEISKISTNKYFFAESDEFDPMVTNVKGIYVAGAFTAPKDIPETTTDGLAVAAKVLESNKRVKSDKFTPAVVTPNDYQIPRVGVLICRCGNILDTSLEIDRIFKELKNIKEVEWTGTIDNLCNSSNISQVKKIMGDNALDRVVVAGCSARDMEIYFKSFKDEGYSLLNFEFVNLREQCIFAASLDKKLFSDKSITLLKAAVFKLLKNCSGAEVKNIIKDSALVIGGGAAGLTSALNLANQGFDVSLVEKSEELGGKLLTSHYTLRGADIKSKLQSLITSVKNSSNIKIFTSSEVISSEGSVGNRRSLIKSNDSEFIIEHGITIIATGGKEVKPKSYGYSESDKIITQVELENKISNNDISDIKKVVMIQCVESREVGKREYCSRVCCSHAIKNALKLKDKFKNIDITVLYRDIRSYGFYEDYYREARSKGVIFIPYQPDSKPQVKVSNGKLYINYRDPILNKDIDSTPDMVVLSSGIEPNQNINLSQIFNLPLDKYGFFEESNKKGGNIIFNQKDIFMAGLCHAPKHIDEAVSQGLAAAARGAVFLNQRELVSMEHRSYVISRFCSGCGICVEVCPYSARVIDPTLKIAKVFETVCESCGACVMSCPNGAAQQYGFEKGQVLGMIDYLIS